MDSILSLFLVMMAIFAPFILMGLIQHYFQYKKQVSADLAELKKDMMELDTDELRELVDNLQERVKVLETIVTDKGYEVSEKIVNLK